MFYSGSEIQHEIQHSGKKHCASLEGKKPLLEEFLSPPAFEYENISEVILISSLFEPSDSYKKNSLLHKMEDQHIFTYCTKREFLGIYLYVTV